MFVTGLFLSALIAVSNEPITTGEDVEIVGFDDMKLLVRRKV